MTNLQTIDLDTLSTIHGGQPAQAPAAHPRNNDVTADVDMSVGGQGGSGRGGGNFQVGGQARIHVTTRQPAYLACVREGLPLIANRRMTSQQLESLCRPLANT